jgi:hypothetical protein
VPEYAFLIQPLRQSSNPSRTIVITFSRILRWRSLMHLFSSRPQGSKLQNAALKKTFRVPAESYPYLSNPKKVSVISSMSILILLIKALLETALLDMIPPFLRRHPSSRRRRRRRTDQRLALRPSGAMPRFVSGPRQVMRAIWQTGKEQRAAPFFIR